MSPTPTEVTSKVFRSTKKNASEAGGALVTVHLPNQAKRRQSRDLLCASLNAAPTRANTISRRHSRAPSTTTSTFRSIISLPSKTCSALFNRSSKSSFHSLGISNRDEPCLYAVVL